mgnify:CR=1 FL=1
MAGVTVVATQSKEPVSDGECHMPKDSTVLERLYLIFLAAYTVIISAGASLRRARYSRR